MGQIEPDNQGVALKQILVEGTGHQLHQHQNVAQTLLKPDYIY